MEMENIGERDEERRETGAKIMRERSAKVWPENQRGQTAGKHSERNDSQCAL